MDLYNQIPQIFLPYTSDTVNFRRIPSIAWKMWCYNGIVTNRESRLDWKSRASTIMVHDAPLINSCTKLRKIIEKGDVNDEQSLRIEALYACNSTMGP